MPLAAQVRRMFGIPASCDPEGAWAPTLVGRAEDCACCYFCRSLKPLLPPFRY